ncbi:YeiH family protein [Arthrobacter sp. HY1533]|uniref:YeiH family protein n=1 Tax=Arthrobacter sp. HY1533 TaxID=2970919 RepID=UPI0022B9EB7F|nr:YeiH family protein [Arthrobacter sp. HY1533]
MAIYAPGLLLCAAAVAVAMAAGAFLPGVSPLIIAIVLGITLTNVVRLPAAMAPGITFAAKKLLRLGIVFLGLQLVLSDIVSLGAPMLVVIVCIVAGGIFGTLLMGRLLKMRRAQVLLIACGFSICGAAAVAGVEGVTDAEEEDVVTAVALVVIFGTLMIPAIPLAGSLLGMDPELNGMWAGGSIHEIAQVVAAGGIIGGGALGAAVVVKLARILLLAPVVAILSLRQRRCGNARPGEKRPPIVPLFIVGFLAMVLLRSTIDLPDTLVQAGGLAQTALLSAAMFALGCGVKIRNLMGVGVRPFILAAASTVLVSGIALAGIELVQA